MTLRAYDNLPGRLALDANALAGLKQQARVAPERALAAAATQFEALFMQMLLKSMREALPQDGPLASETTKQYTAMFDQQIAQQLAKKGIGIADMLVKQLSRTTPAADAPPVAGAPAAREPAIPSVSRALDLGSARPAAAPAAAPATAPAAGGSALPASVRAFVDTLRPYAEAVARTARIPAELLLGQAGLESGWGRHQPQAADGAPSHNLFGIKAGASWTGPVVEAATTEYVDGQKVTKVERFRAYGSYTEAFADFAKLIGGSPRYAPALANAGDAAAYARSMQRAGYATDPLYAAKLTRAIETAARRTQAVPASAWAQLPAIPVDIRPKSA